MRHGLVALVLIGAIGCQNLEKKSTSRHSSVRLKNKVARRLPHVKEVDGPSRIFSEHNDLAKSIPQEATQLQGPVELTDKEKVFFELAGEKVEMLSEIDIYHKVVEKYQQNDEAALGAYANLLLKTHPRSIYCDNALYLQGMLAFSQKKFSESLSSFQKVLALYPMSNKAVSALFAKGVVFKKMNLNKEAVRILAQVVNQYPGSPESERAQVELKLVTQ